jgi:hypothetical protein
MTETLWRGQYRGVWGVVSPSITPGGMRIAKISYVSSRAADGIVSEDGT